MCQRGLDLNSLFVFTALYNYNFSRKFISNFYKCSLVRIHKVAVDLKTKIEEF